ACMLHLPVAVASPVAAPETLHTLTPAAAGLAPRARDLSALVPVSVPGRPLVPASPSPEALRRLDAPEALRALQPFPVAPPSLPDPHAPAPIGMPVPSISRPAPAGGTGVAPATGEAAEEPGAGIVWRVSDDVLARVTRTEVDHGSSYEVRGGRCTEHYDG